MAAAPLIATIAVGVVSAYILDKIDEKLGATRALIGAYKQLGHDLREIEYETKRWFDYANTKPTAIMRLFGGPCFGSAY